MISASETCYVNLDPSSVFYSSSIFLDECISAAPEREVTLKYIGNTWRKRFPFCRPAIGRNPPARSASVLSSLRLRSVSLPVKSLPPRYEISRAPATSEHCLPRRLLSLRAARECASAAELYAQGRLDRDDKSPAELARQTWICVKRWWRCFGFYCWTR